MTSWGRRGIVSGWTDLAWGALAFLLVIIFGLFIFMTGDATEGDTMRGAVHWEAGYLAQAFAAAPWQDITVGEAMIEDAITEDELKTVHASYGIPLYGPEVYASIFFISHGKLLLCEDNALAEGAYQCQRKGRGPSGSPTPGKLPDDLRAGADDLDSLIKSLESQLPEDAHLSYVILSDEAMIGVLQQ